MSERASAKALTGSPPPLPPRPRTSAVCPVSWRKTSSSVGVRTARSSMPIPAASRRRTASAIVPVRVWIGTRTVPFVSEGLPSASTESAAIAGSPWPLSARCTSSRSPPQPRLELVRSALRDQEPVVDDGDPLGQPVGLVEVLRRQEHRRPARDEALDRVPERDPAARVEPGRRLVQEDHGRLGDEGAGEVEPPSHPARSRCGRAGRPRRRDRSPPGASRARSRERRRPRW